ncbi:MAG TPA: hypothetical protein VEC57_07530 [Candidatus Limnocylindrales bacterium]|nr:hypothetical protein [Candidatus Limnocylindrales bacterium]
MVDRVKPIERISTMLARCGTDEAILPPTALYNEGWLLRLVVDWYARHPSENHLIPFQPDARWRSEVLLPSRFFKSRQREGWTHADAVVGHFAAAESRGDAKLVKACGQFFVLEAKLGSSLSAGTKYAPTFNQAARNIACMLHMLASGDHAPGAIKDLGFLVLLPEQRIDDALRRMMTPAAISEAIKARGDGADHDWCRVYVEPEVTRMRIDCVPWEALIAEIAGADPTEGAALQEYYEKCCRFNGLETPSWPNTAWSSPA